MHKVNIENAKYESDYKISLTFDNGVTGVVDLHNIIFSKKPNAFARLQDIKQFKKFLLKYHTIVWGKDLDLAPEFLHDLLTQK